MYERRLSPLSRFLIRLREVFTKRHKASRRLAGYKKCLASLVNTFLQIYLLSL